MTQARDFIKYTASHSQGGDSSGTVVITEKGGRQLICPINNIVEAAIQQKHT